MRKIKSSKAIKLLAALILFLSGFTYMACSNSTSGASSDDETPSSDTSSSTPTTPAQVTYYTVTFDVDGGTGAPEAQKVQKDTTVTKPEDPTKENYIFVGWFLDNTAFDFSTKIKRNITLKARWGKNYNITISSLQNGSINAGSTSAVSSSLVTLNITPENGYKLKSLTIKDTSENEITTTEVTKRKQYTFIMPESDISVSAEFVQCYSITLEYDTTIADFSVSESQFIENEEIEFSLTSIKNTDYISSARVWLQNKKDDYPFDNFILSPGDTIKYCMPSKYDIDDCIVKMNFFKKWDGNTFDGINTQTSNGTVELDKQNARPGDSVTVTFNPYQGYKFDYANCSFYLLNDENTRDFFKTIELTPDNNTFTIPECISAQIVAHFEEDNQI